MKTKSMYRRVYYGAGPEDYRLFDDEEYKKLRQARRRQGGLSLAVVTTQQFSHYASYKHCSGYVGASRRSAAKDRILEKALRAGGLDDNGVADWLTSTHGRHLMDDPGRSMAEFRERVKEYVKHAFRNVSTWSHPDYSSRVDHQQALDKRLRSEFSKDLAVAARKLLDETHPSSAKLNDKARKAWDGLRSELSKLAEEVR